MSTHPMYICDRCGWGHYHPLSYCVKCPGRLVKRQIPHTEKFNTEKDMIGYLAKQGITYIGEYPKVDKKLQLENDLIRYKEQLLRRQLECCFNYVNNENHQLHPERAVTMWEKEIKILEQELQKLQELQEKEKEKNNANAKATT